MNDGEIKLLHEMLKQKDATIAERDAQIADDVVRKRLLLRRAERADARITTAARSAAEYLDRLYDDPETKCDPASMRQHTEDAVSAATSPQAAERARLRDAFTEAALAYLDVESKTRGEDDDELTARSVADMNRLWGPVSDAYDKYRTLNPQPGGSDEV